MRQNKGVPASPSGLRPFGVEPAAQSQAEPLVPNAEERIVAILTSALDPMRTQGMGWQAFYRWMKSKPGEIVSRLRESGVMFRLAEQANWPVVAEVFDDEPHGFHKTVRLQVTIGGQVFGAERRIQAPYLFDRDYLMHLGPAMTRMVVARAAEPFEQEALRQLAIATEARRAETPKSGSVHEGAGPKDIAQ